MAGDMCRQSKRKRIIPRDIALAIKNDDELVSFGVFFGFFVVIDFLRRNYVKK